MAQETAISAYSDIFEQFFDDASFLWLLRCIALKQPHYLPSDILELEQRIEAHLEGLYLSPDIAWSLCQTGLELEEPGEVFTAAMVALTSNDAKKIQRVVEVGLGEERNVKALISALAWLPRSISDPWIKKFLRSSNLDHKYLAIAYFSVLRIDPREHLVAMLNREDCRGHDKLYARCMRLIGEIKNKELQPHLDSGMASESESVVFWARWSAILLGNRDMAKSLEPLVLAPGPFRERAILLLFRAIPAAEAKKLISNLSKDPENLRVAIKASGILGDPQVIPWLIKQMEAPALSRLAAEAFTQITGIDIEENKLEADEPDAEALVDEDSNQDIAMDEDENLPWPDLEKLKVIWTKRASSYANSSRVFLGKPISPEHLSKVVSHGRQRHRIHASIELALINPGEHLPNVAMCASK